MHRAWRSRGSATADDAAANDRFGTSVAVSGDTAVIGASSDEVGPNAIEVYETMLQKWPMDPTAPDTQNAIAETYDQMNITQKPGTPEHDAIAQKALEARTKLANYIGNTPWVDANKDNPAAIQNAERLVRGGLRQAAAAHTNNGKAALVAASETGDPGRQIELLQRAGTEYKPAATGWFGHLTRGENGPRP